MTIITPDVSVSPPEMQTEPPKEAHIVKTEPGESSAAKVTEARVFGTPVEALCGIVFVPSQDARKLPLCQQCKEIYDMERMMNERLNENVGD